MISNTLSAKINADQVIEQFIHGCSHDLRAPLTSIKGLVKVAEYYPQNEEVHNCLTMINNCADTMDKLIRGLEEFMVINHYSVTPEVIDSEKIVDTILDDAHDEISAKAINVTTHIDSSEALITDPLIFSLVIKHLFKNAIAFQDAKKTNRFIDIQIKPVDNFIHIKIADNGIGISPAYNQKIFRPFFKASTQSKGVGMGLFLLNNLLNKINGSVSFTAKEQEGATFTVRLPRLIKLS